MERSRAPGGGRLTIREAARGDVPELSALARRTWADASGRAFTPEDEGADAAARRSEPFLTAALETSVILLAERRGRAVAYTKFGPCAIAEADATARDRELHRLYVETELQGTGIGRTLLTAALAHPELAEAERVFLTVWEENRRAVALYASCGFARVGVSRYRLGSRELEDMIMMRAGGGGSVGGVGGDPAPARAR